MNFPLDGWQHVASSDDYQTWRKPYPGGDYRWVVVCIGGGETHICPAVFRADVDGGVPFVLYTDPETGGVCYCDAHAPALGDEYPGAKPYDLDLAEQDYARARSTPAPAPAPAAPSAPALAATPDTDAGPYVAAGRRVGAVLYDDALTHEEKVRALGALVLEGVKSMSTPEGEALYDRAYPTRHGYQQGHIDGYRDGAAMVRAIYTDTSTDTDTETA